MRMLRLIDELRILKRVLSPRDFRDAMGILVLRMPSVVARRNLTALDESMSRDVEIRYRGHRLTVPAHTIDQLLIGSNDNATFGIVREMFGRDVYLRAFHPLENLRTVLDLGGNRGFFPLIAGTLWEESRVVSVEPTEIYNKTLRVITSANKIDDARIVRLNAFVGGTNDGRTISLRRLMNDHGMERVDFVKCDIEGAEFGAFDTDVETLGRIDNLGMELHPRHGDVRQLVDRLSSTGMAVVTTDQHGRTAPAETADYLYASRVGKLR